MFAVILASALLVVTGSVVATRIIRSRGPHEEPAQIDPSATIRAAPSTADTAAPDSGAALTGAESGESATPADAVPALSFGDPTDRVAAGALSRWRPRENVLPARAIGSDLAVWRAGEATVGETAARETATGDASTGEGIVAAIIAGERIESLPMWVSEALWRQRESMGAVRVWYRLESGTGLQYLLVNERSEPWVLTLYGTGDGTAKDTAEDTADGTAAAVVDAELERFSDVKSAP